MANVSLGPTSSSLGRYEYYSVCPNLPYISVNFSLIKHSKPYLCAANGALSNCDLSRDKDGRHRSISYYIFFFIILSVKP